MIDRYQANSTTAVPSPPSPAVLLKALSMSGIPVDLDKYETYEDYLDNNITETDKYYLEDIELARELIELGYNGDREIVPR